MPPLSPTSRVYGIKESEYQESRNQVSDGSNRVFGQGVSAQGKVINSPLRLSLTRQRLPSDTFGKKLCAKRCAWPSVGACLCKESATKGYARSSPSVIVLGSPLLLMISYHPIFRCCRCEVERRRFAVYLIDIVHAICAMVMSSKIGDDHRSLASSL